MTDLKCPKCKCADLQIVDYVIDGYIYEVVAGVVYGEGIDGGSKHVRTDCVCRECGHTWHPRKIKYTVDY